MYTARFSEFSYGYAITDNFLHSGLPYSPHAPVFPSLIAEGSPGGGYDVRIPLLPVAIFIQFKIPQVVRRRSTGMPTGFHPPYMRMHLRTKWPNQHQLLLDLEATGKKVYYATPDFWTDRKLDEHFSNGRVHERSWYIEPSAIGPLDNGPHFVAYQRQSQTAWRCSIEPKKLEGEYGAENFSKGVGLAVREASRQEPLPFLNGLAQTIAQLTKAEVPTLFQREDEPPQEERENAIKRETGVPRANREETRRRRLVVAAREVAYMSQVRLGCLLMITGRDN